MNNLVYSLYAADTYVFIFDYKKKYVWNLRKWNKNSIEHEYYFYAKRKKGAFLFNYRGWNPPPHTHVALRFTKRICRQLLPETFNCGCPNEKVSSQGIFGTHLHGSFAFYQNKDPSKNNIRGHFFQMAQVMKKGGRSANFSRMSILDFIWSNF